MKKIYQNPITTVFRVELQQMVAASEQLGFGDDVTSATGAESRQSSGLWEAPKVWDTEDDIDDDF